MAEMSFNSLQTGKCFASGGTTTPAQPATLGFNSLQTGKCFGKFDYCPAHNEYGNQFPFPPNGKVLCKTLCYHC